MERAGIAKHNERGDILNINCLRHTFITNLAKSGASMVVTAKAARHSDLKLTLKVYSHVELGELVDAVSAMPQPKVCTPAQGQGRGRDPAGAMPQPKVCTPAQVINGIPPEGIENLSLKTPLDTGNSCHIEAYSEEKTGGNETGENTRKPQQIQGFLMVGGTGLEPVTPCV